MGPSRVLFLKSSHKIWGKQVKAANWSSTVQSAAWEEEDDVI